MGLDDKPGYIEFYDIYYQLRTFVIYAPSFYLVFFFFTFHSNVRLSSNNLLVVYMEVQIMSLLMRQNSNSIRNWRSFTFQLELARLVTVPKSFNMILQVALFSKSLLSSFGFNFQHYQRDIVRGVEGYIVTGSKQVEIGELLKDFLSFFGYDFTFVLNHFA